MLDNVITFETTIPQSIYSTLRTQGFVRDRLAERARHLLALNFYDNRLLSLGQAADLAGMDRWRFIEFLSDNDVSILNFNDEELEDEFAAAETLISQLRSRKVCQ